MYNQITVKLSLVNNPVTKEDVKNVATKIVYDKEGIINKTNLHLFLNYKKLSEVRKILRNKFWKLKIQNK